LFPWKYRNEGKWWFSFLIIQNSFFLSLAWINVKLPTHGWQTISLFLAYHGKATGYWLWNIVYPFGLFFILVD
jgi:hypothetical protein